MRGETAAIAWAVFCVGCGVSGALAYREGAPREFHAEFAAKGCNVESHLRLPAHSTKFYLINGRTSFAWLAVDSAYEGVEVENYHKDAAGHHFTLVDRIRAWQYDIPDEVGATGSMRYFEHRPIRTTRIGGGLQVNETPVGSCELTYVGSSESQSIKKESREDSPPPCPSVAPSQTTPSTDPSTGGLTPELTSEAP